MLDIAVPQLTGGPLVGGAEECRCPPGYAGYSCETCALGHYRDLRDRSRGPGGSCVRCPCSNSEDSCLLLPTGQVQCVCRDGWSGPNCQHRGGSIPGFSAALFLHGHTVRNFWLKGASDLFGKYFNWVFIQLWCRFFSYFLSVSSFHPAFVIWFRLIPSLLLAMLALLYTNCITLMFYRTDIFLNFYWKYRIFLF